MKISSTSTIDFKNGRQLIEIFTFTFLLVRWQWTKYAFSHPLASKYSKTVQFREKLYRIELMYYTQTYNIVFYNFFSTININEDIWKKQDFFTKVLPTVYVFYGTFNIFIDDNSMHSTTHLCKIDNTLRSILKKLAILRGGIWGAVYHR